MATASQSSTKHAIAQFPSGLQWYQNSLFFHFFEEVVELIRPSLILPFPLLFLAHCNVHEPNRISLRNCERKLMDTYKLPYEPQVQGEYETKWGWERMGRTLNLKKSALRICEIRSYAEHEKYIGIATRNYSIPSALMTSNKGTFQRHPPLPLSPNLISDYLLWIFMMMPPTKTVATTK